MGRRRDRGGVRDIAVKVALNPEEAALLDLKRGKQSPQEWIRDQIRR